MIPARAGIGFRFEHAADFDTPQPVAWIEVHSENYLTDGGPRPALLERLRRDYPLSCHGVGLSLGSAGGLDDAHLERLAALYDRFAPGLISDHLAWSVAGGHYLNDLLPLPMTAEALDAVCRNVSRAQERFGRPILVENPAGCLAIPDDEMSEGEFMAALVRRTGCGLLLDVNNIHVGAANLRRDPHDWLMSLPLQAVGEIHVAGHRAETIGGETLLIDDHGSAVPPPVWDLLDAALAVTGPVPVLVEWDTAVPPLPVLLAEAARADGRLARRPA